MDKTCTNCLVAKDLELFSLKATGKFGRTSRCKECTKTITNEKRWSNGSRKRGEVINDLSGKKFGLLLVTQESYIRKIGNSYKRIWKCKCDCGNIVEREHSNLQKICKSGQSCGCNRYKKGCENFQWKGHNGISGQKFHQIRNGATYRKIPFNITIEDIWNLYLKQNKKCALTGLDVIFSTKGTNTASVDRIDSNKGYEINNVQIVHKDINKMKNSLNQEHFIKMCKLIANRN